MSGKKLWIHSWNQERQRLSVPAVMPQYQHHTQGTFELYASEYYRGIYASSYYSQTPPVSLSEFSLIMFYDDQLTTFRFF